MTNATIQDRKTAAALALRAVVYFTFWVVLAGTDIMDLTAGLVTALVAAWISLQLVPAGEMTLRPGKALALFLRFLWQSVVAGVTVARIALTPVMPLRPGMVAYRTKLPPGNRRDLFLTYASLLPGTLPTGSTGEADVIAVHALDTEQPVVQSLAAEEARLAAVVTEKAAP